MSENSFSEYKPPFPLKNGHLQTIYPAFFRKVNTPAKQRVRLDTPDDDFLDVDVINNNSDTMVIISHGLEGSSERPYITGMVKEMVAAGFDTGAWNFRSCSGEINRQHIVYHSGATYDLATVVEYFAPYYQNIFLVGFSLGGNLTLKYLGEDPHPKVSGGVTLCTPMDLSKGARHIQNGWNKLYEKRFLKSLQKKVVIKHQQFPDKVNIEKLAKVRNLLDFDNYFTGPIHGFKDAEDYYQQSSSRFFIRSISVPTLIINPLNDPLLTEICFDRDFITENDSVNLLTPKQGGHCGFPVYGDKTNWAEIKTREFIQSVISV